MSADSLFGRQHFEKPPYNYSYVPEDAAIAYQSGDPLFVWVDPAMWGVAPPAIGGKRVALVANSPVTGFGPAIDSHDEVIRMNRMEYWQRSPTDDGERLTIWAGLPRQHLISGNPEGPGSEAPHTNFPDVAETLSTIWSATPFHLSVAFYKFLARRGLLGRLFVSGSGPFLHNRLAHWLPPGMVRALYACPSLRRNDHVVLERQPYFELLLTGVRVTLFCELAGAREIGLFGFNFYEGMKKRSGPSHDLAFEKELLVALVQIAPRLGSRVVRYGP